MASFGAVGSLAGCVHPWMAVLRGMEVEEIETEVTTPERDFNARRPPGMAPSEANHWVLFIYDPAKQPGAHDAFAGSPDDCFFAEIEYEAFDDEAPRLHHAAACAQERTPKPPPGWVMPQ